MNRKEQILNLFNVLKKHPKWHSFYLKSIKELIDVLNLPQFEIIECDINHISHNEDFCIPLFISKDKLFFPSLTTCFKDSNQNQIVAILKFDNDQNPKDLSICYLHKNELTYLETFQLHE